MCNIVGASLSKPYINVKFVRLVCLSICLSVRTFMKRKYTRVVVIYGVSLVVDSSIYVAPLVNCFACQTCSDKQQEQILILYRSLTIIKGTTVLTLSTHYSCIGCMIAWNASHEGVVYTVLVRHNFKFC